MMASRTTTDFQHHYLLTYPLTKVLLGTPTVSIISLIQKTWSEPFSFVNLNYNISLSRENVNNLVLGSVTLFAECECFRVYRLQAGNVQWKYKWFSAGSVKWSKSILTTSTQRSTLKFSQPRNSGGNGL